MTIERLRASLADRYRVERELGAGGMATVYLAHDLKHDRDVAIKVLHPDLGAALGGERFLSEIRTTARLQHPHILPLLDSGDADGLLYYVMPLVTGETLRGRLDRERQLPIADTVRIAREVASALDYAHRQGVIHRDIKPENILLHDGQALVADFGIALAVQSAGGQRMTQTGLSLGTPQYMSPEQAMGEKQIDARSDVYALAAVTYEMLAGDPPFTGGSVQAIVAKIMTEKPTPVHTLRDTVPEHVEDAVLTGLAKLPADRFATAAEFATALAGEGATRARAVTGSQGNPTPWLRDWRSLVALLALAGAVTWELVGRQASSGAPVLGQKDYLHLGDSLPPGRGVGTAIALSPDGNDLVYISGRSAAGGQPSLAWKRRNRLEPTTIVGSDNAKWPSFSPDGTRLLFVRAFLMTGALEVMPLAGGTGGRTLVADSVYVGASWGDDGYIYFSRLGALLRIPENGGPIDTLTTHPEESQVNDRFPLQLPGGRAVLFARQVGSGGNELMVFDLHSRETRSLGAGHPVAIFQNRILLYSLDGLTAVAAPFDPDAVAITGEPVVITPALEQSALTIANVAFSSSGTMVYWADAGAATRVHWVDRSGGGREIDPEWRTPNANAPTLSPDGQRLALSIGQSIEIKELDRGPSSQVVRGSVGRGYSRPMWRPDGRALLVYQVGSKDSVLAVRDDGLGGLTPMVEEPRGVAQAIWSPDQQWIVFRTSVEGANGADLYATRADGQGPLLPVATSPGSDVTPAFSPDGRWLAYASDESGSYEVYLRPFPNVNERRVQISVRGGAQPRWAKASGELFFVDLENRLVRAMVQTTPTLVITPPEPLFPLLAFRMLSPFQQQYDVTADGQRFVMVASGGLPQLVRIDNWLADYPELQR